MDDPSFAPGIMVFRASLHLAILFTIRHMGGKRANVTVPGYLTHTRTSVSSQCRSLCGCNGLEARDDWMETPDVVNIRGWLLMSLMAAGDAPQTPWTSSGAHVIDRLVTKSACITMFCIVNRAHEMGHLAGRERHGTHICHSTLLFQLTGASLGLVACAKRAKRKGDTRTNFRLAIALWGDARRVDEMSYGAAQHVANHGEDRLWPIELLRRVCRTEAGYRADVGRVISESVNRSPRCGSHGHVCGDVVAPLHSRSALAPPIGHRRMGTRTSSLADYVADCHDHFLSILPHTFSTRKEFLLRRGRQKRRNRLDSTNAAVSYDSPPPECMEECAWRRRGRHAWGSRGRHGAVIEVPFVSLLWLFVHRTAEVSIPDRTPRLSRVSRGYGCENREGQGEKAHKKITRSCARHANNDAGVRGEGPTLKVGKSLHYEAAREDGGRTRTVVIAIRHRGHRSARLQRLQVVGDTRCSRGKPWYGDSPPSPVTSIPAPQKRKTNLVSKL
ncbi:hypothetical protein EDB83DRAFT_2315444 [Lactarius deliciosus]|nr:hypothetical protein EDB83DRAFT_2315444 [Lactarius deliciosus]